MWSIGSFRPRPRVRGALASCCRSEGEETRFIGTRDCSRYSPRYADLTCSLRCIFELRQGEPLPLEMVKDAGGQDVEDGVFTFKSCYDKQKLWFG